MLAEEALAIFAYTCAHHDSNRDMAPELSILGNNK